MIDSLTAKGAVAVALVIGFVGCGLSAAETASAEKADAERAEAVIQKLGGKVTTNEKSLGKPVISVVFQPGTTTDAGLEHIEGLTQLRLLDLTGTQVTDAGLEHLKGLNEPQTLKVGYSKATDAGLAHLRGLTQLRSLNLSGTKVGDAGLDHLKGLTQLQTLSLFDTRITAECVNGFETVTSGI